MPNCFSKVDVPFYVRIPVCGYTLISYPLCIHAGRLRADTLWYLGSDSKLWVVEGGQWV